MLLTEERVRAIVEESFRYDGVLWVAMREHAKAMREDHEKVFHLKAQPIGCVHRWTVETSELCREGQMARCIRCDKKLELQMVEVTK